MATFFPQIMTILWSHLVNSKVHRNIKPQILSVFGDIALQIGDQFEPYMADTFSVSSTAPFSPQRTLWQLIV